jgi:hypothetical protein
VESFRKEGFGESELTKDRRELHKTRELLTDIRRTRYRWLGNMIIVDQEQEIRKLFKVRYTVGLAIAEAVSRWLPTTAARVQSRVWSSEICGGQSGARAGFLRALRFPLPFIPPNYPSSQSPGTGTIGQ